MVQARHDQNGGTPLLYHHTLSLACFLGALLTSPAFRLTVSSGSPDYRHNTGIVGEAANFVIGDVYQQGDFPIIQQESEEPHVANSHVSRIEHREKFTLLSISGHVNFNPSLLKVTPSSIGSRPIQNESINHQQCFTLAQVESGLTDRLRLAVCSVKGSLSVFRLQLCQFNETLFDGDPKIHELNGMEVIEIRLRRKTYFNVDALVRDLSKGQPEAIAFQKRYDLPTLANLKALTRKNGPMGPYDPRVDSVLVQREMETSIGGLGSLGC